MILPKPLVEGYEVAEHYDSLNQFYRDVWGLHRHHGYWQGGHETAAVAVGMMAEKILRAARILPGGTVVDVGCGPGGLAWFFAEKAMAEVVAYTLSGEEQRTALECSVGRGGTAPQFIHSDWLDNHLPDQSVDAVLMIEGFSRELPEDTMVEAIMAVMPRAEAGAWCHQRLKRWIITNHGPRGQSLVDRPERVAQGHRRALEER